MASVVIVGLVLIKLCFCVGARKAGIMEAQSGIEVLEARQEREV